jgi:hypothetical protein
LTVTVRPAIVAVPLRAGPLFGGMASCTVPFPDPLLPFAIAIHDGSLLTAVHEHSGDVVTLTVGDPPAADAAIVSGDTLGLHPPSWFTVKT